jgi:hypothetical protein
MFVQGWWLSGVTHLRPPCWKNISPQEWEWYSTKSSPRWLMYIFHIKKCCAWEVQKFHDPMNSSLTKLSHQNLNHLPLNLICCQCALMKLRSQFLKICLQGCFHHGSRVQISKLSVSFGKHMVGSDITLLLLCHQFPFLLSVNFHLCMLQNDSWSFPVCN